MREETIKEIIKAWTPSGSRQHDEIFIEDAMKVGKIIAEQAKLQRTKEILEMLPENEEVMAIGGYMDGHTEGYNYCLSQIKELLTKKDE